MSLIVLSSHGRQGWKDTTLQKNLTYCIPHVLHNLAYCVQNASPRPRSLLKIIKINGSMQLHLLHTEILPTKFFFNLLDIDFHWSISSALAL